ncbi:arginine deiminase family protein [Sporosarcina thermotolerans]|uniref:Arginine deiminase family protein n=1 Tax=Sporosarcina thermotolerans TaxID=633404 RepID=A0AAW9AAN5_9BACL|nr:arginine deiminase family protein [Sporosarcina thermotolerans]MDW0116661.1 arginine deiminase family protein [Sporosarcina thermotolerans]WHT48858.1 arginine deiminase family protein [Sporosarcina thermotolerans]
MSSPVEDQSKTNVNTEYDTLKRVILCKPKFMAIEDVINDTQKQYADENIDRDLAMKQHKEFEMLLREHGVEVITLPSSEQFPEQVFTRDIGFTVGEDIFVSEMASDIRKGEEEALEEFLEDENIPYQTTTDRVEGGDVIVDRNKVYVGISSRTSEEAVRNLQRDLPKHKIIRVPFNEKYLHLDCVFNILSPEIGLIFPEALSADMVETLSNTYKLIDVSPEEQFTMGTNVLSIGGGKVFSLPQNANVNTAMRAHGFEVIEVDFSEIIKSGGSFRCCSMPLERE